MLRDFTGDLPYGPARNYGSDAVEAWRPLLTKNAGGLPVEFLLAWIGWESGGNPCSWTRLSEAGIFQLEPPDNITQGQTTLAEQHPVPPCVSGTETSRGFSDLTDTQALAQVMGGINFVNWCVGYVDTKLAQYGYSIDTSSADYWSLVKLVHAYPSYVGQMLQASIDATGGPVTTWAELVSNFPQGDSTIINNASTVGQYGAGGGVISSFVSNTLSSIQYLTGAEILLIGLAGAAGIAGAFFLNRWLQSGVGHLRGLDGYRVAYLGPGAKPLHDPQDLDTIGGARYLLRQYKRRGMTAWVEDDDGAFVSVPGATRKPRHL